MGVSAGKGIEEERARWVLDHSIDLQAHLNKRFLHLIENFPTGSEARLCWAWRKSDGIRFKHYFIARDMWTIEFVSNSSEGHMVEIHDRGWPESECEERIFRITEDHQRRMQQVVGAVGYSLCLRNCEHVARYIHSGAWVCTQMLPNGELNNHFKSYWEELKRKCNQTPKELICEHLPTPLYEGRRGFLQLTRCNRQGSTALGEDSYNVVFIGPTGSGKSSVINRLFNMSVCEAGASAGSVTRAISVYEGTGPVTRVERVVGEKVESRDAQAKVKVIDTIGFCDSSFTQKEAVELTKEWLKVKATMIDMFVIVVSGRIEAAHAESIQQMLEWLHFGKYRLNFLFVYNKADIISDQQTLEKNIVIMSEVLKSGFSQITLYKESKSRVHNLNISLGIPPEATFTESEAAMEELQSVVFTRKYGTARGEPVRVSVDTSDCTIL